MMNCCCCLNRYYWNCCYCLMNCLNLSRMMRTSHCCWTRLSLCASSSFWRDPILQQRSQLLLKSFPRSFCWEPSIEMFGGQTCVWLCTHSSSDHIRGISGNDYRLGRQLLEQHRCLMEINKGIISVFDLGMWRILDALLPFLLAQLSRSDSSKRHSWFLIEYRILGEKKWVRRKIFNKMLC